MAAYENWSVWFDFGAGWVDVTRYADIVKAPVTSGIGDNGEAGAEPGVMKLVLNNTGHRFTPASPLATMPLVTGMATQLRETIAGKTYIHHTGTIEFPEIADWAAAASDQQLTVSSVDLLSRFERSQTFISTLAAHILYSGGTALKAYWPMTGPGPVFADESGQSRPALQRVAAPYQYLIPAVLVDASTGKPTVNGGGGGSVAGDDADVVYLGTALNGVAPVRTAAAPFLRADLATAIALASGQKCTLVAWVRTDPPANPFAGILGLQFSNITYPIIGVDTAGVANMTNAGGFMVGTAVGPTMPTFAWTPIAIRWGFGVGTSQSDMWIGRNVYSLVIGGPTVAATVSYVDIPYYQGSIGHVQLYVGADADWGLTQYLAQVDAAWAALERQTTGERIRTLALYGGMAPASLALDPGASAMSAAGLAGQTVAGAMYEARDTEQGRLFVAGDGTLTFQDRKTVLNV